MSKLITGNWGEFVKGVSARVDEIIEETREMGPSFMESGLFETVNSDALIYRTEGVTGLGYLQKFDENGSIKSDTTDPQYKTEYTNTQKGSIITISQLLMKTRSDELERKLDEVRQARIAANRTLNKHAWQTLVDAFTTTDSDSNYPVSRLSDGVAMISASHPSRRPGVANRSNVVVSGGVTNPLYSETAQFDAIKIVREQLNGRGLPIAYDGRFGVVVPPALEKLAKEINKSDLRSSTANNDINVFKGVVDVVVSVYTGAANSGSDTAWYIVALDAPIKPLKYVTLIDPKIEREVDFDTKSIKVSVDMANSFGYSNFEFVSGSDGTQS